MCHLASEVFLRSPDYDYGDYHYNKLGAHLNFPYFILAELHGPYQYKEASKKQEFVNLLRNLKALDGGDCKESTIDGMKQALVAIQEASPMYVFTDAGAKDATDEEIESLLLMSDFAQTSINFFLFEGICLELLSKFLISLRCFDCQ